MPFDPANRITIMLAEFPMSTSAFDFAMCGREGWGEAGEKIQIRERHTDRPTGEYTLGEYSLCEHEFTSAQHSGFG